MALAAPRGGRRRILGVDPGLHCTGYGLLEAAGNKVRMMGCGCLTPPSRLDFFGRLGFIHDGLARVIAEYGPSEMAVEEIFLHRNPRAALVLGHARGAAIVAGLSAGLALHQYTALQIKKAVTGYGRAEKGQVQQMLKVLLGLEEPPRPEDASDAVAVALTHCLWGGLEKLEALQAGLRGAAGTGRRRAGSRRWPA